jgi:hypothetical protein
MHATALCVHVVKGNPHLHRRKRMGHRFLRRGTSFCVGVILVPRGLNVVTWLFVNEHVEAHHGSGHAHEERGPSGTFLDGFICFESTVEQRRTSDLWYLSAHEVVGRRSNGAD